jgi:cyclophilin family peptidyl-prolyl cis-trans isomerase
MKNIKILLVLLIIASSCKSAYKDLNDGLYVDMQTTKGSILLQLYPEETPLTVANFVGLAEGTHPKVTDSLKGKRYFDGNRFHRVVPNFILQCGDLTETGRGTPGYQFADEFPKDSTGGFKYKHDAPGVLSMANPGPPNTNGSQFFITHKAAPWLDGKHSVFGKVVKGQNVVDSIVKLDTILSVKIIRLGSIAKNFDATKAFTEGEITASEAQKEKLEEAKKAELARYNQYLEAKKANYTKMGADKVTATASGLKVLKLKSATGKKVVTNKPISIHYTLYLGDGKRLQSTLDDGGKPFTFQIDDKNKPLITGFKEGLAQLRQGEKARLFIPYYIAYGENGGGPFPPKADIIFEVEILKVGK